MKIALRYLNRGRAFFQKDLPPWLQRRADTLPPYRTNTMAIIASVALTFLNNFIGMFILTICIAGMIGTGTILGVEEGANFVRIKTEGWANDQHPDNQQIYDVFDLRFPQVENGALFLTTNMVKSPVQTRFDNNEQTAARCIGSDMKTESCKQATDCKYPTYTKYGFLAEGTTCLPEGFCLVNAWCNQYRWLCRTTNLPFITQSECETNCPYCFSEILTDAKGNPSCNDKITKKKNAGSDKEDYLCEFDKRGSPHLCYNRYKLDFSLMDPFPRCIEIYSTTNASLTPKLNEYIMDGIQNWTIRFDIFMKFSKYWSVRNIVNEYYKDINAWTMAEILQNVDTKYDSIKNNGIVVAANGYFECTLFSSHCSSSWSFSRLDGNKEGFGLTHRLYIPGVSIFLNSVKSMESRYILDMKGIRLLASISAKMYAPDPMAALIAIGGMAGLMGISTVITNFVMKFISKEHDVYKKHIELTYEEFVAKEKSQIKEAFDIAIAKHMEILYKDEQQMKKILDVADKNDKESRF